MALFKIVRGEFKDLPKTYHDGYAYFCTDTGDFYIDYKDNESGTEIKRRKISAGSADKLISSADKGSGTKPVYFKNGIPVECTYELQQTVSSDALFTDEKVKQNADGSTNEGIPILMAGKTSPTSGETDFVKYDTEITINPAENSITATKFIGNLEGGASRLAGDAGENGQTGSSTQPVYFENGVPKATTYQLNATVPSDAKFTDTNTKVTSVSNHYTPAANTASELSADAANGDSATWNTTNVVTGVNLQRDAKGHVVGVTVDSAKMPVNPNVDTNTAHKHVAGVGLAVEGESNILSGEVEYKAKLKNEIPLTVDSVAPTSVGGTYPVVADKSGNLAVSAPNATTSAKGIVQLSSSTSSTSETLAATPKAVKAAYDLANTVKTNLEGLTITANASDDDVIVLTGQGGVHSVSYSASHAISGVTAGDYTKVSVNDKGHVTSGSNPTTLGGYGITDAYTKTEINTEFNDIEGQLSSINSELGGSIKELSVSGKDITYTKNDGTTGKITTQDTNTDTKVTQNAAITTAKNYPVILGYSDATTKVTNVVNKASTLTYNPSTQILTAPTFKGNLDGIAETAEYADEAGKATNDGSGNNIVSTYETKTDASAKLTEAKGYAEDYTDTQIGLLINDSDPATLNSIYDLGKAIEDNQDAIEALNSIAAGKADATTVNNHINNKNNPHEVTYTQVGAAPTNHASTGTTYGTGTNTNYGHVKLSDSINSSSSTSGGIAATPKAVKAAYDLANGKVSKSGDTMTGTLTLKPASGEGGQVILSASSADTTNNGIIIDTANGDFRIFGEESGTKTGFGTILNIDPYDATITGGYSFDGNAATATKATSDGNGNNIVNTYATKTSVSNVEAKIPTTYAGSSSAGGAANSVKTNLTIQFNGGTTEGTNKFTFNGSTAKTVNIPLGSKDVAGITVVYPAASCTTYTSDGGTVTPLAVQKAAKMFAITRPPKKDTPQTVTTNAISRWENTDGDLKNSKIIIEDVKNTADVSKNGQVIAIPGEGNKKMVYGYCTDQVDGTTFIGGVFDKDATVYPYAAGLAIGGTSGNLLWKGKVVATTDQIPTVPSSLKNPYSLTVQGNGTTLGTYDGSAAKTVNITSASIGAAPSDHHHDSAYVNVGGDTMTGNLTLPKAITSQGLAITQSDGTTGYGISLYGSASPQTYGLWFGKTATFGTHGTVSSDWATYFGMNSGATTRGWVFRREDGCVASISGAGNLSLNGHATIGNKARLQYDSTNECLNFSFV